MTPGQRACEAFWAAVRLQHGGEDAGDWPGNAWEWAGETGARPAWETAAQAGARDLREQFAALATEMHERADAPVPPGAVDLADRIVRAQVLHEYAARIRQALERAGVPS